MRESFLLGLCLFVVCLGPFDVFLVFLGLFWGCLWRVSGVSFGKFASDSDLKNLFQ